MGAWRCLKLTDGRIEAVVATDIGPRILRFGAVGGRNLLHEVVEQQGLSGGDAWRPYGGHRLWHAPEEKPRTYAPDNGPVEADCDDRSIQLTQTTEPSTGIQKQLELRLEGGGLRVVHRLTNRSPWAVELAPWAITMMAPGGVAIVPQEPFAPHPDFREAHETGIPSYLPARTLALWSYAQLNDPRWTFLDRHILLRQDPALAAPIKFGAGNRQGWCAYLNHGELLLKRFPWQEGVPYPDLGCNTEVFTNGDMLEIESLGPLTRLAPGEAVEHVEGWSHASGLPAIHDSDGLDRLLGPILETSRRV
jgi:hypothetical protein